MTHIPINGILLSLTVEKQKIAVSLDFTWGSAIFCIALEYSILFPTFTLFLNVFHLSFCDKFIIRFKATNVVQRIS